MLGDFLLTGQYPAQRIISLAGTGARKRPYLRARQGMLMGDLLRNTEREESVRVISGNLLTGTKREENMPVGFYDTMVTLLPERPVRHFLGWMTPGFFKPSFSRTFVSSFLPGRTFAMDTRINGEERALVMTGKYRKVTALDIYPDFLVKSIVSGDIEQMEELGIFDCEPEDVALCAYICPSKTEFSRIIQEGIEMMEQEGA